MVAERTQRKRAREWRRQRKKEEERPGGEREEKGRKRWRSGWLKVRFKLALGELLPWKYFED